MAEAAFDFLNAEDVPSLPVATQAELLRAWSRVEAKGAAAHAEVVGAFHTGGGAGLDGQRSVGAWLALFARCTPTAGRGQVAAGLRIRRHPHVQQALAAGTVTVSYGRWIAEASEKFLPEDQDAVEQILVEAATAGALIDDLIVIATAALRKLRPGGLEDDEARRHTERSLTVSKTLGGVGRINGDLTAEATALAESVIEALAVKAGPEDTRTKAQRRHDAFAEAMRRLAGSGLLPERGGSKPQVKIDMDLATLRTLPGSAQAEQEWIDHTTAQLARDRLNDGRTTRELLIDQTQGDLPPGLAAPNPPHAPTGTTLNAPMNAPMNPLTNGAVDRAAGAVRPLLPGLGDGATLHGVGPIGNGLAGGLACDAIITPVVTGAIDFRALTAMTEEWLAHHLPKCATCPNCGADESSAAGSGFGRERAPDHTAGQTAAHTATHAAPHGVDDAASHTATQGVDDAAAHTTAHTATQGVDDAVRAESHARLQRSMLEWAVQVLSGPGGLASYLRTRVLDRPLSGPSIVLDAGAEDRTVPSALERLVRRRDRSCRFPGCDHPAALSQVHHIIPRSRNGPTELWNLLTLCSFHHLIAVHTWGWDITLNPDGTTTATAPDGREINEHHPPEDPAQRTA